MLVATWNVNGIRARQAQVTEWLAREAPDVVCLQEIKASPEQVPSGLCDLPGYACHWHGHKGYSGVALLVRTDRFPGTSFFHPPFDLEQRVVAAAVGGSIVASVYVPNGGKDYAAKVSFLLAMERWVAEVRGAGQELVIAGDLNVALTDRDVHPKERKAVVGQLPEERALLGAVLAHGLVDVARHVAPDDEGLFSWWAPWGNLRQRNIGWRIDYVLASAGLVGDDVRSATYREVGTSDHAPVLAWLRDP